MSKFSYAPANKHRYELVRDDGANFIAYQRRREDGLWQTVATWMIPGVACD